MATANAQSSSFQELVNNISNARTQKIAAFQSLSQETVSLNIAQNNLAYASENALNTSDINKQIATHTQNIATLTTAYNQTISTEQSLYGQLTAAYPTQQSAVSQLSDGTPILFLPVRIETSFQNISGPELWVRIFPDDIFADTHETLLTQDEITQGQQYWQSYVNAGTNIIEQTQAWDLLCRSYTAQRAAWVALQNKPANLAANPLVFPTLTPKDSSWTQQPFTRMFPDAFVVNCYTTNDFSAPNFTAQTIPIPDEVKMGVDPNNESMTQTGGDITTDPSADIDWMLNFNSAITKGLGVKVTIDTNSYNSGFTRIVVLGVKASLTTTVSQQRLQDLIDSHHYTDGVSLLQQGDSTNNTDSAYSGYSSVDFSNTTTFETEQENNLFTPTPTNESKTDGQILCEALGIDYDYFYHIYHSNGFDIRDSMNINNALWATSWGYYLNDMMSPLVSSTTVDQLRDFFSDYVSSRGALPSIRSGVQPYGILPATVYSRMDWGTDPMAGLYSNVHNITNIVDESFAQLVPNIPNAGGAAFTGVVEGAAIKANAIAMTSSPPSNASQALIDILTATPVSQDRVQRLGVGAGYIWNNLAYADRKNQLTQEWLQLQTRQMSNINSSTGLPLSPYPRVSQVNFMPKHSYMNVPLVADPTIHPGSTLPLINNSKVNYLQLLGQATFDELRDENYSRFQIATKDIPDIGLYRYVRQSLMLEYYDAACKILNIPDTERAEPELINIVNQKSPPQGKLQSLASSPPSTPFTLYAGSSRWTIMATPYQGFNSIGDFIDSAKGAQMPQVANVLKTKSSILQLASNTVGQLNLLTSGVIDATAHRLDTWKLALVNQRLDDLRGITDGSSSRNEGIYLGAYGWVENIRRHGTRTTVTPPTTNFSGTIYSDSSNEGYIHAPSISQAAAAAVLRNGYITRADSSNPTALNVNISSERIRAALDILEGLRNGQPIAQLLGAQFEERLYDNYTYSSGEFIDAYISSLRQNFTLTNTVTAYDTSETVESIKATNVLDGVKLMTAFQTAGNNIDTLYATYPTLSPPALPVSPTDPIRVALINELNWMINLSDAVGDLSTAESVYQLVQGNQVRSSAIADAVSKGNYVPDIQSLDTPKTGTSVYQRFTVHLENNTALPTGWTSIPQSSRSVAEPYINRWIGELLGDPSLIKCKVTNVATSGLVEVTVANLGIQPIDLVYIVNDELVDDASELSLRIRSYVRLLDNLSSSIGLTIDYKSMVNHVAGSFLFEEVLPLLINIRNLITSCRSLKTNDYITPTDADGVPNQYNFSDFQNRATAARASLQTAYNTLHTAAAAMTPTSGIPAVKNALMGLSWFGFDQTVYEFIDQTTSDYNVLSAYATSVLAAAQLRMNQYDALGIAALTIPPADPDSFISTCLQGLQAVFDSKFRALAGFTLRTQEHDILYSELTGGATFGTLLNDQTANPFVVDEWLSGIAKIRKNVLNYELVSIMGSAVNLASFTTSRTVVPLQVPYSTDGTERWLGANVVDTVNSLKDGRTSFGISIPGNAATFATGLSGNLVGFFIDEWIDMIPDTSQVTGIAFQFNQPLSKPPQCLILGLTPKITGNWQWTDLVDMLNETLDLAKKRAVTYDTLSGSSLGQLLPAFVAPATSMNTTIGLTLHTI